MDLTKKEIRRLIYDKRKELDSSTKAKWDAEIFEELVSGEFYKNSRVIFVYVSFGGEVDTIKFIQKAINDGKTICVPKVISKAEGMEAYVIKSLDDLEKGFYDIPEPKNGTLLMTPEKIDLLVMPGVAFDLSNRRIGYGGGFYDRFLRRISGNTPKIALSYSFQVFESIPCDEFDEKIDLLITNK